MPPVVARPYAFVASLKPAHVHPPPARTVFVVSIVDHNILETAEIDHQSAVVGTETGRAVRTPTHREIETLSSSHADHRGHVRRSAATNHRGRVLVDHAVVNLASLLVLGISRSNHLTLDLGT